MTRKIFRSIMISALSVMAACFVIIAGALYDYFTELQIKQLMGQLSLVEVSVERYGTEYLAGLASGNYRITWIDSDGAVIFDSDAYEDKMDNHSLRPEIVQAFESGTGFGSRYSDTMLEKLVYCAKKMDDGTVLRISVTQASVIQLFIGMLPAFGAVVIIGIIISSVLAHKMSKSIAAPFDSIDFEHPLDNDVYEELSPILEKLNHQRKQIAKQMEELTRKRAEFEKITDNMQEGLVLLNNDGIVISINPAAKTIFDAETDCVGKAFLTVNRTTAISDAIKISTEKGRKSLKFANKGREYELEMSRIDSDGEMIGTVILAFDITEMTFAERNRQEFTANVSHELKTPLQTISGSAELIENGLVKPEDLPKFAGTIRKESARLLTLINDIIKLSQLDENAPMPTESVNLKASAADVLSALKTAAETKNIALLLNGDDVTVNGSPRLITEIIFNLCENAVKYTGEGGRVSVDVFGTEESAVIRVSDNGIGIPYEHQSRIFERFYRVDKSHSRQSGGTGLGLSIVKHAVEYHRGSVVLKSEPGAGTEITVSLPK